MANELTNTELAALIPEIWRDEVLEAREAKQVVVPRIVNATKDVKEKGDIVHFREFPSNTLTVNNVGADGAVANQAITLTDTSLTVDQWKEMTISLVDKAGIQSDTDVFRLFSREFGKKQASYLDQQILLEYTNATTTALGGDQVLTLEMLVDAVIELDDNDVPQTDRNWVFAPVARGALYNMNDFNKVYATGDKKTPLITGQIGDILGAPVYVTTEVATSAGQRKNLFFHREALAIAIQRNLNIEKFGRTKKATDMSGDFLYGIKTIRADHMVVLSTKTSLSA